MTTLWVRLTAVALTACALLGVAAAACPSTAHASDPIGIGATVAPPSGVPGPRPTGEVFVSRNGDRVLTLPLGAGTDPLTAVTPMVVSYLLIYNDITVSYSGDSNYEASDGVTLKLLQDEVVTFVARPRDREAPEIQIVSPRAGVRYTRGEMLLSGYSCRDVGDRSAVTTCAGATASGAPVFTAVAGTFSFTVRSADALGNTASASVTYIVAEPARDQPEPSSASSQPDPPPAPSSDPPPAPSPDPSPALGLAPASPPAAVVQRRPATAPPPGARVRGLDRSRAAAAPTAASSEAAIARVPRAASVVPQADPRTLLGILVAAFVLLQLGARSGGLALAGGAGGVAGGQSQRSGSDRRLLLAAGPSGFDHDGTGVEYLGAGFGRVGIGDRSRTWRWPATRSLDELAVALPGRLARRSPLLARVAADGTYLRAMFGSAALLGPLAGIVLGIAAVRDSAGDAVPPAIALTIAIAVLGVLDATAGLVAVTTFAAGVVALGGIGSGADLRVMLALGALWFVVPVLAGAARPLRRAPGRSIAQSWDRGADFVIASLIGGWAVQKIALALPGLAGDELAIAQHADFLALCALAALVARLGFETLAAHFYPWRLDVSEAGALPQPGARQRILASAVRTAVLVFVAYIVVGTSWQLWVGSALFIVPQLVAAYERRLPNSPALFRARPKGIVELVLLLAAGTAIAALLLHTMDEDSGSFLATAFVLLALPGFLLSIAGLFSREGPAPAIGWGKRIAGVAVLGVGVVLALGAGL